MDIVNILHALAITRLDPVQNEVGLYYTFFRYQCRVPGDEHQFDHQAVSPGTIF
jgi:hypothetical protein